VKPNKWEPILTLRARENAVSLEQGIKRDFRRSGPVERGRREAGERGEEWGMGEWEGLGVREKGQKGG